MVTTSGADEVRIGVVGCGHRGILGFIQSLKQIGRADHVVALCDLNPTRLEFASRYLGGTSCRSYESFESFLQHPGLNTVIVATPDYTHRDFVVRAFESGKDVVCEKPMATTVQACREMMAARGGRDLRVAFNFRYHNLALKVKEILASGAIGRVLQVDAADVVSWQHGGDYFRRWHRLMDKSGGLLVHKSTHSFDAINWWLDDQPASVFAHAARSFYTADRQRGERCATCEAAGECAFHVDLTQDIPGQVAEIPEFYRQIYLEAEHHDGYIRDTCVFHRDTTICDTYNVLVRYAGGALCTYSALFFAPYEERKGAFQGDKGRLEFSRLNREIKVQYGPDEKDAEVVSIPLEPGGHEGADVNLMRSIFEDRADAGSLATAEDGYWSVAVAACANDSIASGREIQIPALAPV